MINNSNDPDLNRQSFYDHVDSTPLKFNLIACSETWITPQADPNQFQYQNTT